MEKSLVRIKEDRFEIIDGKIKKDFFVIKNIQRYTDEQEFYSELNSRKKIYISFMPSDIFQKNIAINENIKNRDTIEKIIEFNLKKEFQDELVFKYRFLEKNEVTNQNIYHVEAIKKEEILKIIKPIENKSCIEIVTTDYHSLREMSSKIEPEKPYISIFLENNKVIYIAALKDNLLYFRESFLYFDNPLLKNEIIASDISRTVMFIKQQKRDIEFNKIFVSGDIENLDKICTNLPNIPISVPLNTNLIKNISQKEFEENFLLLGLNFLSKKFSFEPESIKAQKQFNLLYQVILIFLFIPLMYFGYENFEKFIRYLDNKEILNQKRNQLLSLQKNVKMINKNDLEFYMQYFDLKSSSLKSEFLEEFDLLEPLFNIIEPIKIDASENIIKFEFNKKFDSLKNLITLKKRIENILNDIKKRKNIVLKKEIDFENLKFKLTLVIKRISK